MSIKKKIFLEWLDETKMNVAKVTISIWVISILSLIVKFVKE